MIKKNQEVELDIIDMTVSGDGIGKYDGITIFVIGAIIGDKIKAGITKVKKKYAFARIIEFIEKSPNRVSIEEEHEKCGGCILQNMDYNAQLEYKQQLIYNNLKRIAGLDFKVEPIIRGEEFTHYRNKAQYPLVKYKDGVIRYGFYAPHSHRVLANDRCLIQNSCIDEIMYKLAKFLTSENVSVYNEETKKGLLRHILVRHGHFTDEVMVCFVVNDTKFHLSDKVVDFLKRDERIKSISYNINNQDTNVIMGKTTVNIYGEEYITDKIGDKTYQISANSFFQVNPYTTKLLYDKIIEFGEFNENDVVCDLYCGVGTIGIYIADLVKKVVGIEIVKQAIDNANNNVKINNVDNIEFYLGDAKEVFRELLDDNYVFNTVIIDPPRKGLDASLIDSMVEINPDKIIYVSCDSATLARDIKILVNKGYELKRVVPVDMFPMTCHCENLAILTRVTDTK